MIGCKGALESIAEVWGTGEPESLALRDHLTRCAGCRVERDRIHDTLEAASTMEVPDPGDQYWKNFSSRVRLRIDQQLESKNNRTEEAVPAPSRRASSPISSGSLLSRWFFYPAATAAATALIVATVWMNQQASKPLLELDPELARLEVTLETALAKTEANTPTLLDGWSSPVTAQEQQSLEDMGIDDLEEIDPDMFSDAVADVAALLEPTAGLGWPDLSGLISALSDEEAINLKMELTRPDSNLNGTELEESAG
jgi:hypothetical protein